MSKGRPQSRLCIESDASILSLALAAVLYQLSGKAAWSVVVGMLVSELPFLGYSGRRPTANLATLGLLLIDEHSENPSLLPIVAAVYPFIVISLKMLAQSKTQLLENLALSAAASSLINFKCNYSKDLSNLISAISLSLLTIFIVGKYIPYQAKPLKHPRLERGYSTAQVIKREKEPDSQSSVTNSAEP